mmetsp:Transcript_17269/g.37320  ORF Transcript_17269/g.37320 Transcript_17269/m.37320 type:complete len:163 (-) Transcript_17269:375-863(-)
MQSDLSDLAAKVVCQLKRMQQEEDAQRILCLRTCAYDGSYSWLRVRHKAGRKMFAVNVNDHVDVWFEQACMNQALLLFCEQLRVNSSPAPKPNRHHAISTVEMYHMIEQQTIQTFDVCFQDGSRRPMMPDSEVMASLQGALTVIDAAIGNAQQDKAATQHHK